MGLELLAKSEDYFIPFVDIDHLIWFDGNLLSTDSSGALKTWSPDLKLLNEFNPHGEYPIYHLVADDANKRLFTCSSDAKIHEWKQEEGKWKLVNTLEGHDDQTIRRLFIRGNQLFSGDEVGKVNVWENGKLLAKFDLLEEIWDMIVFDNILVTVRNTDVVLSDIVSSNQAESYRSCIKRVLNGRPPLFQIENKLCFLDRSGMDILITTDFLSETPNSTKLKGHKLIVLAMTGSTKQLFTGGWDKNVIVWNLEKSEKVGNAETNGYINAMLFRPDFNSNSLDGRLYVAGENSCISVFQVTC